MNNNQLLDDEIAELTDALLEGENMAISEDLVHEGQTIRALWQTISPNESLSPAFRERLTRKLNKEWTEIHKQPQRRISFFPLRSLKSVAIAATLLVFFFGLFLIAFVNTNSTQQNTYGTAQGPFWMFLILAGGGAILGSIYYWWNKRR